VISIVNYGMGNLKSMESALSHLGVACRIVDRPAEIMNSDKLVLPGVGSFAKAMENIVAAGLLEPLNEFARMAKRPVLGVCLGMQLLAEVGEEDGITQGLGWIPGRVQRLVASPEIKIPHVGFNALSFPAGSERNALFTGLDDHPDFYFVHSYVMHPAEQRDVIAFANYGTRFVSSVCRGNVYGTQFHPEKSQGNGLRLLHNFAKLAG
jgi:imidazole glycerol-phosphate synthase subunit HisH